MNPRLFCLSPALKGMLELLILGCTRADMSKELKLSPNSVRNRMKQLGNMFDIDSDLYHLRVKMAMVAHAERWNLGIRCRSCD
jgi:hypothetical protein